MKPVDAIYLAAGQGIRAGLGYPKQIALLGGKPIMMHALEILEGMPEISRIVVASVPDRLPDFQRLMEQYAISKATCIAGGKTRQESVRRALGHCSTDRVLIHEAVRPFVTRGHFLTLLVTAATAVVPVVSVVPTIVHRGGYFPRRSELMNVQLPQVFDRGILERAHALGEGRDYSDDSSLVFETMNIFPLLIDGLEQNIKITTPLDLKLAEAIYEEHRGHNRSE